MENKDNILEVFDDKGNKMEMTILFTTHLDSYNKDYVFYYDDKVEQPEVFVSSFDEKGNLNPVENQEEWNELNKVFEDFQESEEENEEIEEEDK